MPIQIIWTRERVRSRQVTLPNGEKTTRYETRPMERPSHWATVEFVTEPEGGWCTIMWKSEDTGPPPKKEEKT